MKALTYFRGALAVGLLTYLVAGATALSGLISIELAFGLTVYSSLAIAIAAAGCVLTQLTLFILKTRQVANG